MKTYRDLKQLLDGYQKKKPWYRYIIGDHPEVKRLQSLLKRATAESENLDKDLSFADAKFLSEHFQGKAGYQNYKRLKLGSTRKKDSKNLQSALKPILLLLKEKTKKETAKNAKQQPAEESMESSEEKSLSEETKNLEKQIAKFSPKEQRLLRSAYQKLKSTGIYSEDVWELVYKFSRPDKLVDKLIMLNHEEGLTSIQIKKLKAMNGNQILTECDKLIEAFRDVNPRNTGVKNPTMFERAKAQGGSITKPIVKPKAKPPARTISDSWFSKPSSSEGDPQSEDDVSESESTKSSTPKKR